MVDVEDIPTGVTSVANDNYEPERCGALVPAAAWRAAAASRPVKSRPTPRRAMRQVIKYSGKLKETLVHEVQSLRPSSNRST